ncbi:C40 family peptidase [Modestobacter italicus]|uniref:C40 family peptidase n=1 Tax=Modestobacter italicus (strain DSM 44449 / CECT 9708 / BC 501) TaxID=2732864 RepID=UPI001C96ABF7
MTTMHTSPRRSPRAGRRALIALLTGAGVVLTPLTAQAAAGGGAPPVAAPVAPVVAPNVAAQVAVDTALAQQGKPYVWAGAGPNSYDCSGLTQYAFAAAGVSLPHSSRMQSTMGTPVARADLQPGDLVFFYDPVGHVGMYIGNGQMVHAPTSGDVVRIADVDQMWGYHSARRLV